MFTPEKNTPSFNEDRKIIQTTLLNRSMAINFLFFLLACVGFAMAYVTPVKEVTAYQVIVHDPSTGSFTKPTEFNPSQFRGSPQVDKKLIRDYVTWRERYERDLFRRDYINVQLHTAGSELDLYKAEVKEPTHPDNEFKDGIQRNVRILTVSVLETGDIQVQFTVQDENTNTGQKRNPIRKSAILSYEYDDAGIQEYEDMSNFLGFLVTKYNDSIEGEIQ